MGTVPANFHGKKGRSGRKSFRDEKIRTAVIEKAWVKKNKRMTDYDATQIVLKDMANKTELSGSVQVQQITGMEITKDDENPIQNQDTETT